MNAMAKETTVRVAVVQAGSIPFDTEACIDKAVRLVAEAAATGARLVVFPEAFVPGYPKGLNYGLVVGARDAAGREEFRLYLDGRHRRCRARRPSGWARRPRRTACYVVIGVIERERRHLLLHRAVLRPRRRAPRQAPQADADGARADDLGLRRRLDAHGRSTAPVGRIGSVICWENYMPMLRMAMYAKGVALYCAPTADDRDTWLPTMRHVALEGRCFVLTACQFIRRKDFPPTVRVSLGDAPDAILMRGGSAIVSPLGTGARRARTSSGETILHADLDLGDIGRGKFDFDVVGHYSRPDVFQLIVNESADACGGDQGSGLTRWRVGAVRILAWHLAAPAAGHVATATRTQRHAGRANDRRVPGSSRASEPSAFRCLAATRRAPVAMRRHDDDVALAALCDLENRLGRVFARGRTVSHDTPALAAAASMTPR